MLAQRLACLAFKQVRLHVPIVTNDRVTFFVGGEKIRMQVGHVYYVNFSRRHYVRNDGDEPRTHFVMDLKVNDWLAQAFPEATVWEQFEFAAARATWPTFWKLRRCAYVWKGNSGGTMRARELKPSCIEFAASAGPRPSRSSSLESTGSARWSIRWHETPNAMRRPGWCRRLHAMLIRLGSAS